MEIKPKMTMPATIDQSQRVDSDDPAGPDELRRQEAGIRQRHPVLWRATRSGSMLAGVLLLVFLPVDTDCDYVSRLFSSTALAVWLFGRFIILAGVDLALHDIDGALSSFHLFMLISCLNAMVAMILVFDMGSLFRAPFVGPRIAAFVADGRFIRNSNPWMERKTCPGLVAFAGFPLASTGSVGGSVFGRLPELGRQATFCCIATGCVLGYGLMYLFPDTPRKWIDKDQPVFRFGGLLVLLLIIVLPERRNRSLKNRHTESETGDWLCQKN